MKTLFRFNLLVFSLMTTSFNANAQPKVRYPSHGYTFTARSPGKKTIVYVVFSDPGSGGVGLGGNAPGDLAPRSNNSGGSGGTVGSDSKSAGGIRESTVGQFSGSALAADMKGFAHHDKYNDELRASEARKAKLNLLEGDFNRLFDKFPKDFNQAAADAVLNEPLITDASEWSEFEKSPYPLVLPEFKDLGGIVSFLNTLGAELSLGSNLDAAWAYKVVRSWHHAENRHFDNVRSHGEESSREWGSNLSSQVAKNSVPQNLFELTKSLSSEPIDGEGAEAGTDGSQYDEQTRIRLTKAQRVARAMQIYDPHQRYAKGIITRLLSKLPRMQLENETVAILAQLMAQFADDLIGQDPFTGTARKSYELFTGLNAVDGHQLSDWEYLTVMVDFGVNSATGAKDVVQVFREVGEALGRNKSLMNLLDIAKDVVDSGKTKSRDILDSIREAAARKP